MATKFQYNEEAHNSNLPMYNNSWGGQTFEHNSIISIEYIELLMHRSGVGGNVTVSIRAVNAGLPFEGDLAVSNPVDCTGITTNSSGEWVTFNFISAYELSSDTPYAIVVRSDQGITNTLRWEVDTSSPSYANGNSVTSENAGSSWTTRSWDFIFRAWGSAVGGGIVTPHFYNRLLAGN